MSSHDLGVAIDRLLDDDLEDAEVAALYVVLEADAAAADALVDRALLHVALEDAAMDDAGRTLANRLQAAPRPGRAEFRGRLPAPLVWAVAATLVCLALVPLLLVGPASASPARLIERALRADNRTVDRRYSVGAEAAWQRDSGPMLQRQGTLDATLWARGGQFVQECDGGAAPLAWGRDAAGAVWFCIAGSRVAVFEAQEIPTGLADLCELRALDVHGLLESLSRDCLLEHVSAGDGIDRIRATRTSETGRWRGETIDVEIEQESLLVRSVTRRRRLPGGADITVTFRLCEVVHDRHIPYDWKYHAVADADILTRESPVGARGVVLREFLRLMRAAPRTSPDGPLQPALEHAESDVSLP